MTDRFQLLRLRPRQRVIAWLGVSLLAITVSAGDELAKIDFRNRIPGVLDAPVLDADQLTPLADAGLIAQLCISTGRVDALAPVGLPTAMQDSANAGYWEARVVLLAGVTLGQKIWVQVRLFDPVLSEEGPRVIGVSWPFELVVTNSPMPLIGLKSFSLFPAILDVQRRGNELLVRWGNIGGVDSYTVEAAASLDSPPAWTPVFSAARNGPFEYTETILPAGGQRYFRLKWWR